MAAESADVVEILDMLGIVADYVYKNYPTINSGGCCVYAAEVATIFGKFPMVSDIRGLVYCSPGYDVDADIDVVRPNISNHTSVEWARNGIAFNHIVLGLRVGGREYHYDANGLYPPDGSISVKREMLKGGLRVDELVQLASVSDGWNDEFDRDNIPAIRTYMKGVVGEYKGSNSFARFCREMLFFGKRKLRGG